MEPSGSNIKKFLVFSQKKPFLIFRETETPKKFLIFKERELSYILGNFLYFNIVTRNGKIVWKHGPNGPNGPNGPFYTLMLRTKLY